MVLAVISSGALLSAAGQPQETVRILFFIGLLAMPAILTRVFPPTTYGVLDSAPEKAVVKNYLVNGRGLVLPLFAISLLVFVGSFAAMLKGMAAPTSGTLAICLGFTALFQSVLAWSFPPTLFGRWKDDYYREKLQWDAFGRFLSDMALMEKYAPEDLSRWGDWLVYGTALGVGDRVVEAMDALNIHIPDLTVASGGKLATVAER